MASSSMSSRGSGFMGQPNKTKTLKGLWLCMIRTPLTVGTMLPKLLVGKLLRKLRGTMSCLWLMSSILNQAKFPSLTGPMEISQGMENLKLN
ncbi:hypothetical protein ES288_A13G034900v1 [Gossypium darwinii]|uniref:Uncharacterized protein n=1 Tax=Gossypium darwinii TaxID=34276 RepID=A0A5D2DVU2_GOSDA|nr:hypothetical protein ES288_A13G034900v1 [Gossypium darwinii]